jgi:hypothetical protein
LATLWVRQLNRKARRRIIKANVYRLFATLADVELAVQFASVTQKLFRFQYRAIKGVSSVGRSGHGQATPLYFALE